MRPRHLSGPVAEVVGAVDLPASKSLTNRALIASAVAGGGRIVRPLDCDDTRILAAALTTAGWGCRWEDEISVGARVVPDDEVALDLGESGTGARLALGLLAASPGRSIVDGSARLRERPMAPLLRALETLGATLSSDGGRLPVRVEGSELPGGKVTIRPEVSSQFVSSLILAAPLMRAGVEIEVVGDLPSAPYLDLTMDVLRAFGGEVASTPDRRRWRVAPLGLNLTSFRVEGDWSAAAFFLSAVAVAGGEVDIGPLDPASRQGDREAVRILGEAGLEVEWNEDRLTARGPITGPIRADLENCPDLFPALVAAAACNAPGSRFTGLEHLVHKESDRLSVMVANLGRLGAEFSSVGPGLEVTRPLDRVPAGGRDVTAAGDHRIAMAMAVTALGSGPLDLDDGSCVSKSFPQFWRGWDELTGAGSG